MAALGAAGAGAVAIENWPIPGAGAKRIAGGGPGMMMPGFGTAASAGTISVVMTFWFASSRVTVKTSGHCDPI